jgi:hypothetical protein
MRVMRGLRGLLLLVLLATVACKTRIRGEKEHELHAGLGVSGLPGIGGSITAGQVFWRKHPKSDFAFEMRAAYQKVDDSATQSGKFAQVQAGVRQVTAPGHPSGWVLRYGVTWFRATGDPAILDKPGDYLGAYGSVAYEWLLDGKWSLGPEITLNMMNGEGNLGWEFLPQAAFNLYFNF